MLHKAMDISGDYLGTVDLVDTSINLLPGGYLKFSKNYYDMANLMFPVNFSHLYIIIVLLSVFLIYNFLKNRKISWLLYFCTGFVFLNVVTVIAGAPFDWSRLMLPSLPVLLLLFIRVISVFFDGLKQ